MIPLGQRRLPTLLHHHVGGRDVESVDGATFEVREPVGGTTYTHACAGGPAEVDLAVAAAGQALREGPWPQLDPRSRATLLNRVADLVEERRTELARLETFDTGLPVSQALDQARRAAENFRFFADLVVAQRDEAYHVPGTQLNYVHRRPAGVAALITPWNTPFMIESWKLAPALAAGCTVVLKPAESTPLSADLWADVFAEAELPPGVFNLVHGSGDVTGDALVRHPDVAVVSFIGASGTGARIAAAAAPTHKGLSMELGGKSPVLVFADADLDVAVEAVVHGAFSLNGERCTAGSRLLVERPVYDEVTARVAERADALVVGHPADPETEVGALVHADHTERVLDLIEQGSREGRLVAGGGRPRGSADGNFVRPTVLADVPPDAVVFQEAVFGPVLTVTPFDTLEEAVALANATRYGLAAYVWTRDLERAHHCAASIQCGMVWLNSHNVRDLRTPFGGVKASGLGHEGGYRSLDFFSEQTAVHVSRAVSRPPPLAGASCGRHHTEGP